MNDATIQLGAFDVGCRLGSGGMASVYEGKHRATGIPVAIKVIRREAEPETRRRFHEEVQAHAGLLHPGIVYLFEYGTVGTYTQKGDDVLQPDDPFVAMELADRGTVRDAMPMQRWESVRELLVQVLDALAHAHARGVIHRDLKPENLLVFDAGDDSGDGARVKLADFGIAHAFGSERERRADRLASSAGTPYYMAPEQLRGRWRDYGPWTDLYALGCTVWELVCGRPPFTGSNAISIANSHISDPRPPFEPAFPVPDDLGDWIGRCLSVDPGDRFRHAADAARTLPTSPSLDDICPRGEGTDSTRRTQTLFSGPTMTMAEGSDTSVDVLGPTLASGAPDASSSNRAALESSPPDPSPPDPSPADPSPPDLSPSDLSPSDHDGDSADRRPPRLSVPDDWRPQGTPPLAGPLVGAGLGLFGLREAPFVNRREACDTIWEALRRVVDAGTTQAVFITGEAGTGKSRLAEHMATRADELGVVRVVHGVHTSEGTRQPGIRGALERTLRTIKLERDEVFDFLSERLPRLGEDDPFFDHDARALTEFLRPTDPEADEIRGPRYHFSDADQQQGLVLRTLRRLTRRRPLFLWLDDLQWGRESLNILEWLADASTDGSQALIVATVRSDIVANSPELRARLRALDEAFDATQLELLPLGRDHQQELLQQLLPLDPEFAEYLADRTEGHPLFAMQLLGHWIERDVFDVEPTGFVLSDAQDVELPDDIHHLWVERIGRLWQVFPDAVADDGRDALELAAALGREVDAQEWRGVLEEAGVQEPPDFLDRLLERRLAERKPKGWSFTHGLLVESLAAMARRAGRREQQHRQCARGLAQVADLAVFGTRARIAEHWRKGGRPERALEPLLEEIRLASSRGFDQEMRRLLERRNQILTMLDLPSDDPRCIEQTIEEASLEWWAGNFERARELLMDGWSRVDDSMPALAGNIASIRARIETQVGNLDAGRRWADHALECGDDLSRCVTYRTLAWVALFEGNLDEALQFADRASEMLDAVDDDRSKLDAKRVRAVVLDARGEDGAEELLREVCQKAETLGVQSVLAQALNALGTISEGDDRFEDARRYFDRYLQAAREMNDPAHWANAHLNLAGVSLETGELKRARRHLDHRDT
ncbi:MAG: serine/threonine-protein kinase PknK, partial [Persicimonas sp.]